MRTIVKNTVPAALTSWLNSWRALVIQGHTLDWKDFPNPEKSQTMDSLIEEQGAVCCYCEARIGNSEAHIEHFQPRSLMPHLAFDYDNLLASCEEAKHCGSKKGNSAPTNLISPLQRGCESHFVYTSLGEISGNDFSAKETVRLLGLNDANLCSRRLATMKVWEELTPAEATQAMQQCMQRDNNGQCWEFATTVQWYLENYYNV